MKYMRPVRTTEETTSKNGVNGRFCASSLDVLPNKMPYKQNIFKRSLINQSCGFVLVVDVKQNKPKHGEGEN